MIYSIAGNIFFEHFRTEKLLVTQTIAAAIDPTDHMAINNGVGVDHRMFTRYQKVLATAVEKDDSIAYAYSLTYDEKKDALTYTIDGETVHRDTVWVESDAIGFGIAVES
jgi:hypothetical protein